MLLIDETIHNFAKKEKECRKKPTSGGEKTIELNTKEWWRFRKRRGTSSSMDLTIRGVGKKKCPSLECGIARRRKYA